MNYFYHELSKSDVRINNNSAFITGYAATIEPTIGHSATSVEGNRYEKTDVGIDGTYSINYLNPKSIVASTTNNYTGIYDISGGAWEYVMGYTTEASTVGSSSGITSLYSDFFNNNVWDRYYDKYSSTANTNYNNRILGDATGEMGPFGVYRNENGNASFVSSWNTDYADFINANGSWFERSGGCQYGILSGETTFHGFGGGINGLISFRIVLAP